MSAAHPVNFRTLDLNLLRVFDVVMEERSVTRAALRLNITQPAVSNALRRLRESAREELFIPSSSGMQPTPPALALWPVVRAALAQLQQAFEPQPFDPRQTGHSFTLAMADATAALIVPLLAQRFQREQTLVALRVVPLSSRDPRALLERGAADVAIGFFPDLGGLPLAEDEDGGSILRRPLYSSEYVCVMRHDHPLAAPAALTLDAYCAARHLRVSFAGRARGFVDDALSQRGLQREVGMIVNSFFTAGLAVRQSDLLTVLPRGFVGAAGIAADLAVRSLPFELPSIAVSQLWHTRHAHDRAQRWLHQELSRVVEEIVGGGPLAA